MSTSPLFFQSYQKGVFLGEPLERALPPSTVAKVAQPIFRSMGRIKSETSSIPSANHFHALADSSTFIRNALPFVGGGSVLGETSPLYGPIGGFMARDNYKQMKTLARIGDHEGYAIERAKFLENSSLAIGSVALEVTRGFGIASEITEAAHQTTTLSAAGQVALNVFNWLSGIFFSAYYALFSYRIAKGLVDLGSGKDLRAELLAAKDPIKALEAKTKLELRKIDAMSTESYEAIAVEEGVLWLEKLAKEANKRGEKVDWDQSDAGLKKLARNLLLENPAYMQGEMGAAPSFLKGFNINELARFGKFMAVKRLAATLEGGYSRLLGADAVAAVKSGDVEKFQELLNNPSWKRDAVKLVLSLIGLAATIAGAVLTGGTFLIAVLVLYGIAALIWIAISDGAAFKEQWANGEVKKRDKWIIAVSVVLSVVAIAGLITLTALSGGLTLIPALILTTAWLITNARALQLLVKREISPWNYSNIPTAEMFRKLTEDAPSPDKIEEILNKMSAYNQQHLRELHKQNKNWQQTALVWERHAKQLQEAVMQDLLQSVRHAS
jgi:hypothetical protein